MRDTEISLWSNYVATKSVEAEKAIVDYTDEQLKKSLDWFIQYYSDTEVHKKFKNKSNPVNLITGLKKIKVIVNVKPSGSEVDEAWGWIYTNNLYAIYINFYNFFNGRIDASVYETIVHEMGHLVDFQLRSLRESPSYMEGSVLSPKSRVDDYIISREEDYARIQRLRNLLHLHPFEDHTGIGDSLMKLVVDGKMYIPHLAINVSNDKKKLIFSISKKIPTLTMSNLAGVLGSLVMNDYLATDIGYLFAKYAKVSNGKIEVDLVKIATINRKFVNTGKDSIGKLS